MVLGWFAAAIAGFLQGAAVNWVLSFFWDPPWLGAAHYTQGWWAGFNSLAAAEVAGLMIYLVGRSRAKAE